MANIPPIDSFKFFANMALPLVYDETLSYYETLNKVVYKLNEIINLANTQSQAIEDFETQITEFVTTWENNLKQELEEWKTDTEEDIDGWLNNALDSITAWEEQFENEYALLKEEVEQIAEDADAAKTAAENSATAAAESAENAARSAEAIASEVTQIETNTNDIVNVKNAMEDVVGNVCYLNWSENRKYILLSGETADVNSPATASGDVHYQVIDCLAGDVFTVTASGGSGARAWGFVASDGTILAVATSSVTYVDIILTAPQDAVYLVVNDTSLEGYVTKGIVIKERVETLEKKKVQPVVYNVINKNDVDWYNGYIQANGTAVPSNSFRTTGYIPCRKKDIFRFCTKAGLSSVMATFYTSSKTLIGHISSNSFPANPLVVPDKFSVAYMRISIPTEKADYALYNTDYPIDKNYDYNTRIVLAEEMYANGQDYMNFIAESGQATTRESGKSVITYPVSRTVPYVKFIVDTPQSEDKTITIRHYGKNGALYATSANIPANAPTGYAYMAAPAFFEKGKIYAISFEQDVSIASSTHSRISVAFPAVAQSTVNILSPNYYSAGRHIFVFQSPYSSYANVSYYHSGFSEAVNITKFQIEPGEYTDFENVQQESISVTITPSAQSVDVPIGTMFDGYNIFATTASYGHLEVIWHEKLGAEHEKNEIPWHYACGKIAFIGDSLTAGLYAPISVGEILENYPYYLGRMLNAETTVCAKSGGDPEGFYTGVDGYSAYDFSQYDTVILWLGTNGGMNTSDIGISGTEAYYYEEIIKGIKQQKSDILIFLGTVFTTGPAHSETSYPSANQTNEVIHAMAESYNLPIVDFSDLTASGYRLLHNLQNNTHMGKAGNIYIANRVKNTMQKYFEEDIQRIEFGLFPKD